MSTILKFIRQLISILANQVEALSIALRLFLLAAQIADECEFEDLTYDLYVEAFTVYEESISESRAQLQAIVLIIGTLQGAKVFGVDNYDTLITKAALHGAKLLKKPHQASAVHLASHMWWQEVQPVVEGAEKEEPEKSPVPKEEGAENAKSVSRDFCAFLRVYSPCYRLSTLFKTANACWNACRSRSGSQIPRLRRLSRSSCMSIPWINTYSTSTEMHQPYVHFLSALYLALLIIGI